MVKPIKQLSVVGGRSNERACGEYLSDAKMPSGSCSAVGNARRDGLWELVEEMGRGKGLL